MSIEPGRSLLILGAASASVRLVVAERRETRRVLAGLSDHLLEDIGYVRNAAGFVRPI